MIRALPETIERFRAAGVGVEHDVTVASRIGCSRERVRQVRVVMGLPRVKGLGPAAVQRRRELIAAANKITGSVETRGELCERLGVAPGTLVDAERTTRMLVKTPRSLTSDGEGARHFSNEQLMEAAQGQTSVTGMGRALGIRAPNLRAMLIIGGIADDVHRVIHGRAGPVYDHVYKTHPKTEEVIQRALAGESLSAIITATGMSVKGARLALARSGRMEEVRAARIARWRKQRLGESE